MAIEELVAALDDMFSLGRGNHQMSDASQDVPEAPIAERLADLVENMLNGWPADRPAAKVTLDMTFDQWGELLETLRRGAYEVSDQE